MKRLIALLLNDISFQFRHGLYFVYIVITILYILLLQMVPNSYAHYIFIFLIFADVSALGFFFVGGIYLLEKDQGIHAPLFATPIRAIEYITAKLISLTLIALGSTLFIAFSVFGLQVNYFILCATVAASASLFTMFGLGTAVKVKSVNAYLFLAMTVTLPLFLPILGFLDIVETPVWSFFPTNAILYGLWFSFEPPTIPQGAYIIFSFLIWSVVSAIVLVFWFQRYAIKELGGGK
ncbi:MAG: hypothetical protein ACLFR1_10405 [Spirochaetia bacterium]